MQGEAVLAHRLGHSGRDIGGGGAKRLPSSQGRVTVHHSTWESISGQRSAVAVVVQERECISHNHQRSLLLSQPHIRAICFVICTHPFVSLSHAVLMESFWRNILSCLRSPDFISLLLSLIVPYLSPSPSPSLIFPSLSAKISRISSAKILCQF